MVAGVIREALNPVTRQRVFRLATRSVHRWPPSAEKDGGRQDMPGNSARIYTVSRIASCFRSGASSRRQSASRDNTASPACRV
jgi:hypothetical protein